MSNHSGKYYSPITFRALLIGSGLVLLNCYLMMVAELRWYIVLSLNPLFVTPIFFIFCLTIANAILRRCSPDLVLRPGELFAIYLMLALSCTFATHDYLINLLGVIGYPAWGATASNRWEDTLFPHLPHHLFVWDKEVLAGLFQGASKFSLRTHLPAFAGPLLWWSAFILVSVWMMFCLNVLLRRSWLEHTRLSFPIVQLPVAMISEDLSVGFFRSRYMWVGFSCAFLLCLWNGLSMFYPALPPLRTRARFFYFYNPPWNYLGWLPISFYPFAIGLCFLVPLDVSFSCWFFYLFARFQPVIGALIGLRGIRDFPFISEQGIGAWWTYGVLIIYWTRNHWKEVFHTIRYNNGADKGEPLRYRTALSGFLFGLLFLLWFWHKAGMSLLPAFIAVASYFLLAFAITRVRAEAASQHTVWDLEPMRMFQLVDSRWLGPSTLGAAATSHWFWRLNRSHTMPTQLEGMQLAHLLKIPLRGFALLSAIALILALIGGIFSGLHILYKDGGLGKCQGFPTWTNYEAFTWLDNSINIGYKMESGRIAAVGLAALFVGFLSYMRARFTWFPFHPLGYCVGPGLIWLWCPFFIAWLSKLVITRYGGMRGYRRAVPFFLGLVLGDYVMAALWAFIGMLFNIEVYQIFH